MLPLHPWYPTRSNCARNTPTCSPCKPFRRTRPFRRRAQGGPFNACLLSPHTDTGASSVRLPVPIEPLADDPGILIPAPLRPSYRCPLDPHAGTPSTPHTDKVISPGMKHSHPRERTLDEGPHPIPHNKRGGEHGQTHRHQRRYRSDVIAATLSSVIATPSFASHSPICATRQTRTTSRKMSSSSSYVPPMTLRATSTSGAGSFA